MRTRAHARARAPETHPSRGIYYTLDAAAHRLGVSPRAMTLHGVTWPGHPRVPGRARVEVVHATNPTRRLCLIHGPQLARVSAERLIAAAAKAERARKPW